MRDDQIKFDAIVETDTANKDKTQRVAVFVCEYFYQKYGVKRLVQKRLRELLASIRQHRKDNRVRLFAQACGLWEPLSQETVDFFMSVLSAVMMDELNAGSEGRRQGWLVTIDGHTWVPRRACRVVARRQFDASPARQKEIVAAVEVLPSLPDALVERSKIKKTEVKIGGEKVSPWSRRGGGDTTAVVARPD